jgi:hypothetical protein
VEGGSSGFLKDFEYQKLGETRRNLKIN